MKIDFLTIFPTLFESYLQTSMMNIAERNGSVTYQIWNIRDYAFDKHKTVDDYPYGGGPGMVMKIEPLFLCLKDCLGEEFSTYLQDGSVRVILMSAQGRLFNQETAKIWSECSQCKRLIFVCGHYRGVDERFMEFVTDEVSIGDYVLTGGELPAMVMADSVVRLLPNVLHNEQSVPTDSFFTLPVFDCPVYTRPRVFEGREIPEVLFSGNHAKIEEYRNKMAVNKTRKVRPDLYEKLPQEWKDKE